jgi:hypothetical protein
MSHGKGDWCCKGCKGPDGQPWRNWASKPACFKCKVHKGKCFLRLAEKPSSPSISVRARPAGNDGQAKQLAKEVDKLKGEIAKLRGQVVPQQAVAPEQGKANIEDHSLEFYLKQRAECQEGTKLAIFLDQQICEKREAKLQQQPGSVKLSKADKQVGNKKGALEAAELKVQELEKKLQEAKETRERAVQELQQAEDHRKKVLQELGPDPAEPLGEGLRNQLGALQEQDFQKAGCTKEQVEDFLGKISALLGMVRQTREQTVPQEEDRKMPDGVASVPAVGTQAVVPGGGGTPEHSSGPEGDGDISMEEVDMDEVLAAVVLDTTDKDEIKRRIQQSWSQLHKRRRAANPY